MLLPPLIRKLLVVLRGGVSPVLIFLSVLLGFWFGLVPGWSGFHLLVFILVVILNVHVGLFLMAAGVARGAALAGAVVLYQFGRLVHLYLEPVLRLLSSVPLIGLTDFRRYAVAGAFLLGPVLGAVLGLLLARAVISFRKMLLRLEEGSEAFRKWYSNPWVRLLDRVLIGKRTKDVKSLFTTKTKIIRKAGVVLALLIVGVAAVVGTIVKDQMLKDRLTAAMTKANGAQVDLEQLKISLLGGALSAEGLEVTDPEDPKTNQLSVARVAADASVLNLLRGKLVLDELVISEVAFNRPRSKPGKVLEPQGPAEAAVFDPCEFNLQTTDLAKLDRYLQNAKLWKQRLEKLRRYLPEPKPAPGADRDQRPEQYLQYLQARSPRLPAPRVVAKKVVIDEVQLPTKLFGNSRIVVTNFSDAPHLLGAPVVVQITSKQTQAALTLTVDYNQPDQGPRIHGTFEGFDLATLQSALSDKVGLVFRSGVARGSFDGRLKAEQIDLTIDVHLQDPSAQGRGEGLLKLGAETTSQIFDALSQLQTRLRIVGPVREPRILFDTEALGEQFKQALLQAGKSKLTEQIGNQLQQQLGKVLDANAPPQLKDALKKPQKLLEGLGSIFGPKDNKNKKD